MTDRPILFSSPMIRALLDGRKTQTRRVLNSQPPADMGLVGIYAPKLTAVFGYETPDADHKVTLRYMPGDRLYVREAWRVSNEFDEVAPRDLDPETRVRYEADPAMPSRLVDIDAMTGKFRQAMHMPRWASRLTLIVTDVRVQRLREISWQDAKAEGISGGYHQSEFATLWDSINDKRPGCSWADNPWIVAVSFDPIKQNIDQIGRAA